MNDESDKKVVELNLDDILPNRFQPRIKFDENALNELANSIKEHGVIQPIIVREIGDKYEIIAGERRYKASLIAGKQTIPAIISNMDDKQSAEVALIENIQRKDLSPIEEAISYKKILEMGHLNQDALAARLDVSQSTISNKLRLLNLDEEVQEALLNNEISERHARSLLKLEDKNDQKEMLKRIINERLTVRKTDNEIDKLLRVKNPKKTDRKEENIMDEQQKDKFNIPSSPIIENIEIFDELDGNQVVEPVTTSSTNIFNDNNVKPGFLDIDKIEQTAEEINVEKPLADIDSLLKADENMVDSKPVEEDKNDVKIKHGKFFSFIEENENEDNLSQQNKEQNEGFEFDLSNSQLLLDEELTLPEINYDETIIDKPDSEANNNNEDNNFKYEPDYNFNFNDFEDIEQPTNIIENNNNEYTFNHTISDLSNNNEDVKNEKSFNEIIKEIREFTKRIEEDGYFLEIDELDLGDSYQVILTITKNK